jgi:hypothetical protein
MYSGKIAVPPGGGGIVRYIHTGASKFAEQLNGAMSTHVRK